MRAALVALCFFVGLPMASCQNKKPAGAWLLMRRDVGGSSRLVIVDAREPGVQRLALEEVPGTVISSLVVDGGRTVFLLVGGRQIWRVRTQPTPSAEKVWGGNDTLLLKGASADGHVLLVGHGRLLLLDDDGARIEDLEAPPQLVERNGDLSEDGQRVLLSFVPADSCPERPFAGEISTACPLEIWGLDRRGGGWRVIVESDRHSYNPRFAPGTHGEEIFFHSPVPDEKCRTRPLWGCGVEDLYRVRFDGEDKELVRNRTWVPRFSPDGKWMAASSPWEDNALLVGPTRGELHPIAADARYALHWSEDSKWIAYQDSAGITRIIQRDGSGAASAGEGMAMGWLAQAVPAGDVVPPTPTEADHLADALSRVRAHRQGDEPLALLRVPTALADAAADAAGERFGQPAQLVEYLERDQRVLAIVPADGLCDFHRHAAARALRYAVLEDPGAPFLLITNRPTTAEKDTNPIPGFLQQEQPASVGAPISATLGGTLEIAGVEMPTSVQAGETFRMTIHYHLRGPIDGDWRTFVHFDGAGLRFQADHDALCKTRYWPPDYWISDSFAVTAAGVAGTYTAFAGMFAGRDGDWARLPVTSGAHDPNDRVPLGTIRVQ